MLNIVENRQKQIMNYLKTNQFARVIDLIELVNYSEATIKRDLLNLEEKGLLRRTRGGAMIIDDQKIDIPYLMKIAHLDEQDSKQNLSNIAGTLLKDDMVIFIDSSTTCLHLVKKISKFEGLKVITNGVITAALLSEFTNAQISVLGGKIVSKRATINGAKAFNDVLSYNADIAFVGCRGFDFENGITETHEEEALIKRAFRKQSKQIVVLATQDKINNKYIYQSLPCHDIDYLITDYSLNEAEILKLKSHRINYLR